MAAQLSWSVMRRTGSWLLPCPNAFARACSRVAVSPSSAAGVAPPPAEDKARAADELPNISFLELLYRMVFQGFYNRLHELQVRQIYILSSLF